MCTAPSLVTSELTEHEGLWCWVAVGIWWGLRGGGVWLLGGGGGGGGVWLGWLRGGGVQRRLR
eukprot:SAG22_NODE_6100_length_899_cov_1.413016_1_plen_62_part_01